MKGFFITGTDTDCGKTYALCQLLTSLAEHGKSVLGLKPVASGCHYENGELISDDVALIAKHNPKMPIDICHWKFLPPISPHLAAELNHQTISAGEMKQFCEKKIFTNHELLFIEGAGGVMAPLNASETWLDFIKQAELSVILVVGIRLGCLNHALLSELALKTYDLPCFGWIANCLDPNMLVLEENIDTLKQRLKMPYLGAIPYQGGFLADEFLSLL